MKENVEKLLSSLSVEEKCLLLSGSGSWHTAPVGEVPVVAMNDGPHGLRRVDESSDEALPATLFPTLASLASTWDRRRAADIGRSIATEAADAGIGVMLAPGVNIKRSPLCGRNFEYFSEDPYLAGQMAADYIKGMQSQGVGASIKHFVANNQETRRMIVDAEIDERTLREIYLPAFETAVKEASPWTVMCAYNSVNGLFCSENRRLLTDILRSEWGYDGLVMSDWGAVLDRVEAVKAGLDLEMPGPSKENKEKLMKAVEEGRLSMDDLDTCARRVIELALKANDVAIAQPPKNCHMTARRCAAEGMVLAKNDGNLLPLIPAQRVALIGPFGLEPVLQGCGSSQVNPSRVDVPLEEMRVYDPPVFYAQGFRKDGRADEALLKEALSTAAKADVVVVMVGLLLEDQTEGADRTDMLLPSVQNKLVNELCAVHKNVVAVVTAGSPVELPWADKVKALLIAYPSGQAMGGALADVLYGIKEPSGRLAETWPVRLEDTPAYLDFPGGAASVKYSEGVFVGYRWYDSRKLVPLFPFGHGLSYTTFKYTEIKIEQEENEVSVSLTVTNTGSRTGRPVIQLYVAPSGNTYVPRPIQELKGFDKCRLSAGESAEMAFKLDVRAFSYYDVKEARWIAESGSYEIKLGTSSRSFFHRKKVNIPGTKRRSYTIHSAISDLLLTDAGDRVRELLSEAGKDINNVMVSSSPLRSFSMWLGSDYTGSECEEVLKLANGE